MIQIYVLKLQIINMYLSTRYYKRQNQYRFRSLRDYNKKQSLQTQ